MTAETKKSDYLTNSVESDRCLAYVVKIDDITPIDKAESIELATVGGWSCVVKKGEYIVNDIAVYCSIDSVLNPEFEQFAFLKGQCIRTKKIMNVLSQGLLMPISYIEKYCTQFNKPYDESKISVSYDLTSLLDVRKCVGTEELIQYVCDSKMITFPDFVPKTEEVRLQHNLNVLKYIKNRNVVITRKEDGTSTTFIYINNEFIMCGRNVVISSRNSSSKHYYDILDKFDIQTKMTKLGLNIAIQGETVGPKVNGNKLNMREYDYRVFNIYDIDKKSYMTMDRVIELCSELKLNTVPILFKGIMTEEMATKKYLLDFSNKLEYDLNRPAEGIVVKTNDTDYRISFKVISNTFLLKHKL